MSTLISQEARDDKIEFSYISRLVSSKYLILQNITCQTLTIKNIENTSKIAFHSMFSKKIHFYHIFQSRYLL